MKFFKLKSFLFCLLAVVTISFFFTSCQKDLELSNNGDSSDSIISNKAQQQLDMSLANWNEHFGKSAKAIGYEVIGEVNSNSEVEKIIKDISSNSNYVPHGDFSKPSKVLVSKIKDIKTNGIESRIQNLIVSLVKPGQTEVKIKWELNGGSFYSTAIVDEDGIVYDNMIFNAVIVEEFDEPILEYSEIPSNDGQLIERGRIKKEWVWPLWRVKWLFGSERGKGWVKAGVHCSNGKRRSGEDTFAYGGYFEFGSQKTEARRLQHDSCNKFKYVYGWSTVIGSVKFDKNNFDISISGLGSKDMEGGYHGACCWGTM